MVIVEKALSDHEGKKLLELVAVGKNLTVENPLAFDLHLFWCDLTDDTCRL